MTQLIFHLAFNQFPLHHQTYLHSGLFCSHRKQALQAKVEAEKEGIVVPLTLEEYCLKPKTNPNNQEPQVWAWLRGVPWRLCNLSISIFSSTWQTSTTTLTTAAASPTQNRWMARVKTVVTPSRVQQHQIVLRIFSPHPEKRSNKPVN